MNMISLAWSQVTKAAIKYCFIKAEFAHQKLDDNIIINEDDWNLLRAESTQSEPYNNSDDEEECKEVVSPTFQDIVNFASHNTGKKTFQDHNSLH